MESNIICSNRKSGVGYAKCSTFGVLPNVMPNTAHTGFPNMFLQRLKTLLQTNFSLLLMSSLPLIHDPVYVSISPNRENPMMVLLSVPLNHTKVLWKDLLTVRFPKCQNFNSLAIATCCNLTRFLGLKIITFHMCSICKLRHLQRWQGRLLQCSFFCYWISKRVAYRNRIRVTVFVWALHLQTTIKDGSVIAFNKLVLSMKWAMGFPEDVKNPLCFQIVSVSWTKVKS